jgi:predicted nucleotidyltransferase
MATDEYEGDYTMTFNDDRQIQLATPSVSDHPIFLWLGQNFRRILGRPMKQQETLDKVVKEMTADENVLAILLFGSVASGTHSWKSDIDLVFVYETHDPPSGLVDRYVDGVLVQYFYTTLDTLVKNQETVPYLLHMFCDAEILLDRYGSVGPVIDRLKQYYTAHPEMEAEWIRLKELHQTEKKGPACAQTTIIQRWDELEDKYSGGVRKRTFLVV